MGEAIKGAGQLIALLTAMAAAARAPRPALESSGDEMVAAIQRNFDAGGRPAWTPLSPNTRRGGRLLNRSGRLRGSFAPHVRGRSVSADSDTPYGPRQHFGYKAKRGATGRGHSTTPARPFAELQDEDLDEVVAPIGRHVVRL